MFYRLSPCIQASKSFVAVFRCANTRFCSIPGTIGVIIQVLCKPVPSANPADEIKLVIARVFYKKLVLFYKGVAFAILRIWVEQYAVTGVCAFNGCTFA